MRLALAIALVLPVLAPRARAAELSLQAGPAAFIGDAGVEAAEGLVARLGLASEAKDGAQVELALEAGRSATRQVASGEAIDRAYGQLSVRYAKRIASRTRASPLLFAGLDLGMLAASRAQAPEWLVGGIHVAAHVGAGVRVPLTQRTDGLVSLVVGLGGLAPAAAVMVGGTYSLE